MNSIWKFDTLIKDGKNEWSKFLYTGYYPSRMEADS